MTGLWLHGISDKSDEIREFRISKENMYNLTSCIPDHV